MRTSHTKQIIRAAGRYWLLALTLGLLLPGAAAAFNLSVVDHNGAPITSGFNWLLEEDNTTLTELPITGLPVPPTKSVSLDIHKSYAPVVLNGRSETDTTVITPPDPAGRYMLSVLPDTGYTLGGINVNGDPAEVTVVVHTQFIPTAQISVLVFKDHAPINNAFDPGEAPLPGAVITISDAGGQIMQDAFGSPLGTTYLTTPECVTAATFDPATCIDMIGNGLIVTDAQGIALIKNINPGKYGVVVSPPTVDDPTLTGAKYIQTSTIEGTRTVDAWVKADEPPIFVEGFGTGFHHVFIGFLNPAELDWATQVPQRPAGNAITGNLRYNHFGRPPTNQGFFIGPPVKDCWVGLNDPVTRRGLYATPCYDGVTDLDPTVAVEIPSSFYIPDVPPGNYELVTWDVPLDALFGFHTVTMPDTGTNLDLGTLLSFRWFGSFIGRVFLDDNENGFPDAGEIGLAEQNINIRFRDGTIYQAQPTDIFGGYALEEVFPFFKWLVVEVDFARFKATGLTTAIDNGGEIPAGFDENDPWGPLPKVPTFGQLNPQPQAEANPNTGNNLSRTETGPALTQAMHLFLNQTNVIDWGKNTYTDTENGGISGVVFYAVTRAEHDPRYAAAEPWEPGIPRVQINLYRDQNGDEIIDDVDGDGLHTLADVDNYPLDNFPGLEDLDRNGNGIFDTGDAINFTYTDSFDDSAPSGCVQDLPIVHGQPIPECADAYGTWNQVRPGVFDGGYAFSSYFPGGMNSGSLETDTLPSGVLYIVEAATPPGYLLLKEEDKNVDFGNESLPSTQLLPPYCIGDPHTIPQYLSFQTDDAGVPLASIDPADLIESPYWDPLVPVQRPLCDRKKIGLSAKENAAADFFFFTKVPKAARAVGFANNDLSAEFNQGSPNFGEKAAPSWIPVAFKDWKGNEVARVYTDEFGGYNAMLPSTFTVNAASPTGISPNMLTLTLNDPVLPDGTLDPNYDPDYSVTSWTFQYEAGRTSYLDTPLVPVAAFVNFPFGKLDAEPRDLTPMLTEVTGPETATTNFGPLLCLNNPDTAATATFTLTSAGLTTVPNPDYSINGTEPVTIVRDFGFGADQGRVLLDLDPSDPATPPVDITTLSLGTSTIDSWTDEAISITLDTTDPDITNIATNTNAVLTVERADNGRASETGIALAVISDCASAVPGSIVHFVGAPGVYPSTPIQDAIDAANPGDYVLVPKGAYNENVIMDKPVRLLGAGGANTVIAANPTPAERLANWHDEIVIRLGGADPFGPNEAPGIMVLGQDTLRYPLTTAQLFGAAPAMIDGIAISGAIAGGGLAVHTEVYDLVISNNRLINNQGMFAGGITIGTPDIGIDPAVNLDSNNDNLVIRGNWIAKNGGIQGGGGIGIYSGSDNYLVENNVIVGNFSRFSGAGINHVGLSNNGRISHNKILFNEVFYGLLLPGAGDGGGINLAGEVVGADGSGAGSVTVDGNLIQGNLAGSGLGGGINVFAYDHGTLDDLFGKNYHLTISNNMIVNNVAGFMAGGIYLHDAIDPDILNNTIVNNDASSTAALAFPPNSANSNPQPAGLVASAYSPTLVDAAGGALFPNPLLVNNIIRHNRSFYNDASYNNGSGGLIFNGYWDLAVVNTADPAQLNPADSILSSLTGPDGGDYSVGNNSTVDPTFVRPFINTLYSAAVADEGGNAISVRFTPLSESMADYHLTGCSPAVDAGTDLSAFLTSDYDRDVRDPNLSAFDIGADEFLTTQTEYSQLTLLSPNGREVVPAGSNYTIAWGAPADAGITGFNLYFSMDGGISWFTIVTDYVGFCYDWEVPTSFVETNSQFMILVEAVSAGTVIATDFSDGTFTFDIQALTAPNGGEVLLYDATALPLNTYNITWQNPYLADPTDVITLYYRWAPTMAWTPITDVDNAPLGDFPGPGDIDLDGDTILDAPSGTATSLVWEIPAVDAAITTVQVHLVITKADGTLVLVDVSDDFFTIRPAPLLPAVVPPVGPALPPDAIIDVPTTGAGITFQCPGYDPLTDFDLDNDGHLRAAEGEIVTPLYPTQVCLHLAAGDGFTTMADGYPQYMFGFTNVTGVPDDQVMNMWDMGGGMLAMNFPAPLIRVREGDKVYLTLSNVGMMMRPDLFDPHTVHWHGFPNASAIFDGVPDASISINMGSSLTYFYNVVEPGTFMYHCHVEATEHMQMGMLGNLYVSPAAGDLFAYNDGDGSTGFDREYHLQIASFDPDFHDASINVQPLPFALMDDKYPMINGRGYPDTVDTGIIFNQEGYASQPTNALITANPGERVLLRFSSLSTTSFHTITVLGIPMQVVGQGSRKLGPANDASQYRLTNSVTIGGGQATDVILDLTGVAAGTYFLYVNNLDHLTNHAEDFGGMMTEIRVGGAL